VLLLEEVLYTAEEHSWRPLQRLVVVLRHADLADRQMALRKPLALLQELELELELELGLGGQRTLLCRCMPMVARHMPQLRLQDWPGWTAD
jgi:hypothetical protein